MPKFFKATHKKDIPTGGAASVQIEGKNIALFNIDGTFYAIDNECNHVGGPLCDGNLNGTSVTCPWHGAQFDVTSGKALGGPASGNIGCYKVKVEGEEIHVEV